MLLPSLASLAVLIGNLLVGATPGGVGEGAEEVAAIRLEVSVSERQLRVFEGDEVVRSYPVAVGKAKYPTPRGRFAIRRMIWNPRWVPPDSEWAKDETAKEPGDPENPMGKVKIFFREPDYYIHGTDAEESLGRAASHGCVRMANSDAVELARLVMEHGGENRPPSWFKRIINFVRSTQEVRLSQPVPLRIVS